jgi:hypothetical protein
MKADVTLSSGLAAPFRHLQRCDGGPAGPEWRIKSAR